MLGPSRRGIWMDDQQSRGRRWFDATINAQNLAVFLAGVALAAAGNWFGTLDRITKLESRDLTHEERMSRIEREQQQQRSDSKEQVRAVQEQVTGVAGDVKEILRYLRDNSAAKRPELGRWSK